MKLLEFAVSGYKNLSREVRLEGLGRVNVIHGDNNVGKSNLLEAMRLFFLLLCRDVGDALPLGPGKEIRIDDAGLLALTGAQIADIYDLRGPPASTIRLEATFAVSREGLERAGIKPLLPTDRVVIAIELEREYGRADLRLNVPRFVFGDGRDAGVGPLDDEERRFVHRIALYLTRNQLTQSGSVSLAFALIDEARRIRGSGPEAASSSPSLVSSRMLLDLWDASSSTTAVMSGRWRLLRDLVRRHLPPFGEGELLVNFDRHRNEAFLMHEVGDVRTRHHLLGTGVQQVLNLLGLLLTTPARLVAIEEPECNLRYALQLRVREAFDALTQDDRGPRQIFLTSHSPAFETEAYFYGMRLNEQGAPIVERRRSKSARQFLGLDAEPPPVGAQGEVAWVSSEGLLLVPPRLRGRLDVASGGEVAFVTNAESGRVEVLSEREFLDLLGPEDAGTDA